MARTIYNQTPDSKRDAKKKELSRILSVSERTVRDWLSRIDKDSKEARNRKIFELWLAGWTAQEVADQFGMPQQTVSDSFTGFGRVADLGKTDQASASHATDFPVPIYNVWKQQEKSNEVGRNSRCDGRTDYCQTI